MTRSCRMLFGLLLLSPLAAVAYADAALARYERRETDARRARVIVELDGIPAAQGGDAVTAASQRSLFARLRDDAGLETFRGATSDRPAIVYEYRHVFLGAAIDADIATIDRIRSLSYVREVHPDREVSVSPVPAVAATTAVVDARAKVNALPLPTGGAGIVVAVIDTGIDYMHRALGGGFGPGFKVAGGYDFVNHDGDPIDDEGHGTHVAGTIAASAADLIGVAPEATLLAYKVLGADGSGSSSAVIAAIERSVDPNGDGDRSDRVDVVNLSLGGPGDAEDPVSRAVDNAVAAGVVVVVAAGNDGGMATIGSPGTALRAITVAAIDEEGRVTSFSSRGPSPRLLGFKPDISAPGFQVVSASRGGGTVALSGTSMAAPHVAGVAALLRELHPDWAPDEVKASITSSAAPVADPPFARGAGRVDARAADGVTLLASVSGLSYGIRASRTGSTVGIERFTLSNRGASTQSLSIAAGARPAGVTIRIEPLTVEIPPHGTAEVTVEIETADDALEFPDDALVGGEIEVSGTARLNIAWAILRTSRARITYDGDAVSLLALGAGGARGGMMRNPRSSELFLPPGHRWDFLLYASDFTTGTRRFIVRSDVAIDGDHLIELRAEEAALELDVDGRDESGRPLAERRAEDASVVHLVGSRILWTSGSDEFSTLLLMKKEDVRRLLFSPLPENYELYHFEQFIDFGSGETYTIEHELLAGLRESRRLDAGGEDLIASNVAWRKGGSSPIDVDVCAYDALTRKLNSTFSTCFRASQPSPLSFVHRANQELSSKAHSGMMFRIAGVLSPAFRVRDGATVLSSDRLPSPVAERIADGGSVTLAAGPSHPFGLPGTRRGAGSLGIFTGFGGAAGEVTPEWQGTNWIAYGPAGHQIASGSWRGGAHGDLPPAPQPNGRFVAIRDDLPAGGRRSRGTVDVRFGSNPADLAAPTLTSLRTARPAGTTTDRFDGGEAAELRFSVVDIDWERGFATRATRPEATRAWYRVRGTAEWIPLTVRVTGSESGSRASLGHVAAGDMYAADMTHATAVPGRAIDVRIEFADAAGNRVEWTQEAVATVGDSPPVSRRRSVRP